MKKNEGPPDSPIQISDTVAKHIEVHQHHHASRPQADYCPVCRKRLSGNSILCEGCSEGVCASCLEKVSGLCYNCHDEHRRQPDQRRLLVQMNRHKVFLWFQRHLVFGRAKSTDSHEIDLVLRYLPLKPEKQYPENQRKTAQLPRLFGAILLSNGRLICRNLHSTRSFTLDRRSVEPGQEKRISSDEFALGFEGGLTLMGSVYRSVEGIDAVSFARRGNHEEHAYYLIPRRLVLIQETLSHLGFRETGCLGEIRPTTEGPILQTGDGQPLLLQPGASLDLPGFNLTTLPWHAEEFSVI